MNIQILFVVIGEILLFAYFNKNCKQKRLYIIKCILSCVILFFCIQMISYFQINIFYKLVLSTLGYVAIHYLLYDYELIICIKKALLLTSCTCISVFISAVFIWLYTGQGFIGVFSNNPFNWLTIVFFAVGIKFIILTLLEAKYEKKLIWKQEMNRLELESQFDMEFYKQRLNEMKEIQKMYHEVKHLTLILEGLKGADININNAEEYIVKLKSYIDKQSKIIVTGNELLDLYISEKIEYCNSKGIQLDATIDVVKADFISTVDVMVIFGNIIDNAIEACEKIGEGANKIEIMADDYEQFIIIKSSNPVKYIIEDRGGLLTTKRNKKIHGLGMSCLEEVLEKYGGQLSYKVENGYFKLTAIIPININNTVQTRRQV